MGLVVRSAGDLVRGAALGRAQAKATKAAASPHAPAWAMMGGNDM
jgi:hypothetical protein